MSNIVVFKVSKKRKEQYTDALVRKRAEYLYWITNGFEFMCQDPDVRERFDNGEIEL